MSTPTAPPVSGASDRRSLSYAAFAVIVVIYLGIIQLGGLAVQHVGDHDDSFATTEGVLWNMWIPIGGALIYTYAVIAVLGWWRPVLREPNRVRSWVYVVPIVFVVCSLVAIESCAGSTPAAHPGRGGAGDVQGRRAGVVGPGTATSARTPDCSATGSSSVFGVDAGLGCFVDAEGVAAAKEAIGWDFEMFVGVDAEHPKKLDLDGRHTMVIFSSGWGDGSYTSWIGRSAEGDVVCLVADLLVVNDATPTGNQRR